MGATSRKAVMHSSVIDGKHSVRLVDVPGSPKARNADMGSLLGEAAAIVFVIDAMAFGEATSKAKVSQGEVPMTRVVASQLKRLLTHPTFVDSAPPLLIAFNKTDLIGKSAKPGAPLESSVWLRSQRDA